MKVRLTCLVVLTLAVAACSRQPDAAPPMPPPLADRVDRSIDALLDGFDGAAATEHVAFAGARWRLSGNAGFNEVLDHIRTRLEAEGFAGELRVDEHALEEPAWDYSVGTLALAAEGQADEAVLSRERHHVALCINSFPTRPEGIVARLVDVDRAATDEDFAGKDLAGAVVLGDASTGALWRRAVVAGGAIGIVSTSLGEYITPDLPGAPVTPREQWDVLQWGRIPYDPGRRGFGFKASPRAAAALRQALSEAAGSPVHVRVTIESTFTDAPARTLVAEIPGRVAPNERVVMASHVQEPGANDNASGVATLAELARAMSDAIREGRIEAPARTLTFLWIDEIDGSRRWLADHPAEAAGTRYMFSLDMTGGDPKKTGGTALVERWPDPAAVWARPWDPHSAWGESEVSADSLHGDLINDLHLAVCRRVASKTGWTVATNPYEGGSDHTVFGEAGIPSILNWHFTDRYYHSNLDTADKTSPDEMRNAAAAVGTSAWVMATADEATALAVARLVADAGAARIALEEREGAALAAADADPGAALERETVILAAWRRWYREAIASVSRLVVGGTTPDLQAQIDELATGVGR